MGYIKALEAAGASVIAYEQFGSYQGEWWAKVSYEGCIQYVNGAFGSCSYCDAFESEFGYAEEDEEGYQERLSDFGRTYLEGCSYSLEEAIEQASRYSSWDSEAKDMVEWLKANAGGENHE